MHIKVAEDNRNVFGFVFEADGLVTMWVFRYPVLRGFGWDGPDAEPLPGKHMDAGV